MNKAFMMNKKLAVLLSVAVSFAVVSADGGTIKIPKEKPVMSVTVPDSWEQEELEDGIECESPDEVVTIFFEVTPAKGVDDLIDANVDWLMTEQKVEVDEKSQTTKDFTAGGLDWKRISWEGKSEEYGASDIGFLFTDAGNGNMLTVTYWITKKDKEKHLEAIGKIFESVKKL